MNNSYRRGQSSSQHSPQHNGGRRVAAATTSSLLSLSGLGLSVSSSPTLINSISASSNCGQTDEKVSQAIGTASCNHIQSSSSSSSSSSNLGECQIKDISLPSTGCTSASTSREVFLNSTGGEFISGGSGSGSRCGSSRDRGNSSGSRSGSISNKNNNNVNLCSGSPSLLSTCPSTNHNTLLSGSNATSLTTLVSEASGICPSDGEFARVSPSSQLSSVGNPGGNSAKAVTSSGSSVSLSKIVIAQIFLLLSSVKGDQDQSKMEQQLEQIHQLMDIHDVDVFAKYFRRLLQHCGSKIFPGASAYPENAGSYRVLAAEVQKLERINEQAYKIAESIDTTDTDLPREFNLLIFMDHFKLTAIGRSSLLLALLSASKTELRSQAENLFRETIIRFIHVVANPELDSSGSLNLRFLTLFLARLEQTPPLDWQTEMKPMLYGALRSRYEKLNITVPIEIRSTLFIAEFISANNPIIGGLQRHSLDELNNLGRTRKLLAGFDARDLSNMHVSDALLYLAYFHAVTAHQMENFIRALTGHRFGHIIDWTNIVRNFDREGLSIAKAQFLKLYYGLLPLTEKYENFDIQSLWSGIWKNPDAQLAFVVAFLSCTADEVDVTKIRGLRRAFSEVDFSDCETEVREYAALAARHPLVSFDATTFLFNVVFRSQESYNHAQSLGIPESVINVNTDIFLVSASAAPKPWTGLQEQALRQLFWPFLRKGLSNYDFVMVGLWQNDSHWVISRFVDAYTQNGMFVRYILEHAEKHGWLEFLLGLQNELSVDLATLAHGHGMLNIKLWFQEIQRSIPDIFPKALAGFTIGRANRVLQGQRDRVRMNVVDFSVGTVYEILQFLEGLLREEDFSELIRTCIFSYPRIVNWGCGYDEIIEENSKESGRGNGISEEIDGRMQEHYKRMYSGENEVREVLERLQEYKRSTNGEEQDLYASMIHGLFDEFNCFGEYPNEALATTAVLLGGMINFDILSRYVRMAALWMIYETINNSGRGDSLFKFGLQAVIQFSERLAEWPGFCERLLGIRSLEHSEIWNRCHAIMYEREGLETETGGGERGIAGTRSKECNENSGKDTEHNREEDQPDSQKGIRGLNIDDGLDVDLGEGFEEPSEEVMDKVRFLLNNITEGNVEEKTRNLKRIVERKYFSWFAEQLIEERAKVQENYHSVYDEMIEQFDDKLLKRLILKQTYKSTFRMINSASIMENMRERGYLKTLGRWLGLITLAKNKPIMKRNINFVEMLMEGFEKDGLLVVIPFTCKVIGMAGRSTVFRPPNPWLMEVIGTLIELYHFGGIKLSLKFEIELMCRELEVECLEMKPGERIRRGREQKLDKSPDHSDPEFGDKSTKTESELRLSQQELQKELASEIISENEAAESSANPDSNPLIEANPIPHTDVDIDANLAHDATPDTQPDPLDQPFITLIKARLSDLFSRLVYPPSLSLTSSANLASSTTGPTANSPSSLHRQQVLAIRKIFQSAVKQSIMDIIGPVVTRSVTIASIATNNLLEKDFVLECDIEKFRSSAESCVRKLCGSLAMVTSKEPIRMSIMNHIRYMLTVSSQVKHDDDDVNVEVQVDDNDESNTFYNPANSHLTSNSNSYSHSLVHPISSQSFCEKLPKGVILMFVNDNLDKICGLIEQAAEFQAVHEIHHHIHHGLLARQAYSHHLQSIREHQSTSNSSSPPLPPFCHPPHLFHKSASLLPYPFKLSFSPPPPSLHPCSSTSSATDTTPTTSFKSSGLTDEQLSIYRDFHQRVNLISTTALNPTSSHPSQQHPTTQSNAQDTLEDPQSIPLDLLQHSSSLHHMPSHLSQFSSSNQSLSHSHSSRTLPLHSVSPTSTSNPASAATSTSTNQFHPLHSYPHAPLPVPVPPTAPALGPLPSSTPAQTHQHQQNASSHHHSQHHHHIQSLTNHQSSHINLSHQLSSNTALTQSQNSNQPSLHHHHPPPLYHLHQPPPPTHPPPPPPPLAPHLHHQLLPHRSPLSSFMEPLFSRLHDSFAALHTALRDSPVQSIRNLPPQSPIRSTYEHLIRFLDNSGSQKDLISMNIAQTILSLIFFNHHHHPTSTPLEYEVYTQLLLDLCKISLLSARLVLSTIISLDPDKLLVPKLTSCLMNSGLLHFQRVDVALSRSLLQQKPSAALFLDDLVDDLNLRHSQIILRFDLPLSTSAITSWSSTRPDFDLAKRICLKISSQVVPPKSVPPANSTPPILTPSTSPSPSPSHILALELPDIIFSEWVHLLRAEVPVTCLMAFIYQLHNRQVLSHSENSVQFFRTCIDICLATFDHHESLSLSLSTYPNSNLDAAYFHTDALAKLIVFLVQCQSTSTCASPSSPSSSPVHPAKLAYFDSILSLLLLILSNHHNKLTHRWCQRVWFRLFSSIISDIVESSKQFTPQTYHQLLIIYSRALLFLQPSRFPGFAFAWLALIANRYYMPSMLILKENGLTARWHSYLQLLRTLLSTVCQLISHPHPPLPNRQFYRAALRLMLVLHHDFPEFLSENFFTLSNAIHPNCIQLLNLVISAGHPSFPEPPDPFTSGLKQDRFHEINRPPKIRCDYLSPLKRARLLHPLSIILSSSAPFLHDNPPPEVFTVLNVLLSLPSSNNSKSVSPTSSVDPKLIHALVLYVGASALITPQSSHTKSPTVTTAFDPNLPSWSFLIYLAKEFPPEPRYHLISAIVNHMRYPNSFTRSFAYLLLHLFGLACRAPNQSNPPSDIHTLLAIQEQITRVLLERLLAERPYPWGFLISLLEILRNPAYNFWDLPHIRSAPELRNLFSRLLNFV